MIIINQNEVNEMSNNFYRFNKVSKFISLILLITIYFMGCNHKGKNEEQQNMNQLPDELISNAQKILSSNTKLWRITHYEGLSSWLHNYKVICVIDSNNKRLIYLNADDKFWRLNCSEGIDYINKIIMQYQFFEESFSDADKVQQFLRLLLDFYQGPDGKIASKRSLKEEERGDDLLSWMQGEEKDKSVFRNLCSDPIVERQDGNWKVTFNFFNSMGGVEQWIITGEIENINRHPQVHSISSEKVKENGTFYYPIEG